MAIENPMISRKINLTFHGRFPMSKQDVSGISGLANALEFPSLSSKLQQKPRSLVPGSWSVELAGFSARP
jgi:hypothetical protein